MSIFDWVASLLAAYIVGRWLLGLRSPGVWAGFLVAWTAAGVAIHLLFGVPTQLGFYLGLNPRPHRATCV